MRKLLPIWLLACSVIALAKDKPTEGIVIVDSRKAVREYSYTTPGTAGTANTNCDTNVYGDSASTNCTTVSTPGSGPQTQTRYIGEHYLHAVLPNGKHATLECDTQWRWNHCGALLAGNYDAEIDYFKGVVIVHQTDGKRVSREKYHVIGSW